MRIFTFKWVRRRSVTTLVVVDWQNNKIGVCTENKNHFKNCEQKKSSTARGAVDTRTQVCANANLVGASARQWHCCLTAISSSFTNVPIHLIRSATGRGAGTSSNGVVYVSKIDYPNKYCSCWILNKSAGSIAITSLNQIRAPSFPNFTNVSAFSTTWYYFRVYLLQQLESNIDQRRIHMTIIIVNSTDTCWTCAPTRRRCNRCASMWRRQRRDIVCSEHLR